MISTDSNFFFFIVCYILQRSTEALIMRLCALAVCLVLGIGVHDGWGHPVKSVFVEFPGDVIKNMSVVEQAEVSSRWLFFVVTERCSQNCEQSSCAGK